MLLKITTHLSSSKPWRFISLPSSCKCPKSYSPSHQLFLPRRPMSTSQRPLHRPLKSHTTVTNSNQGFSNWIHANGNKPVGSLAESKGLASENDDNDGKKECNNVSSSSSSSPLLNLPNILTIGRVGAIPLLVVSFYLNAPWASMATTGIFVGAAVTDWLDGYLARKMGVGSAFGAFLDPVADKLIVATTLVLLCTQPVEVLWFGQAPWILPIPAIAIIGREITMSAVREWAASQGEDLRQAVAVSNLGKWKTASQMVALTILLAIRDTSLYGGSELATCGVAMLYVAAGLGVWSLASYVKGIWRVLIK